MLSNRRCRVTDVNIYVQTAPPGVATRILPVYSPPGCGLGVQPPRSWPILGTSMYTPAPIIGPLQGNKSIAVYTCLMYTCFPKIYSENIKGVLSVRPTGALRAPGVVVFCIDHWKCTNGLAALEGPLIGAGVNMLVPTIANLPPILIRRAPPFHHNTNTTPPQPHHQLLLKAMFVDVLLLLLVYV
jgi:hypothetical protein